MTEYPPKKTRPAWLFVLYLCNDHKDFGGHGEAVVEAVERISRLKDLKSSIDIVCQFDSWQDLSALKGLDWRPGEDDHATRLHVRWDGERWEVVRHDFYKTMNTGDRKTLEEFFDWGRDPISSAEHVVMIMFGMGVGDKRSIVGNIHRNDDYAELFSICDDDSSDDALNPIELRDAFENLVNEMRDGEPIDVLGFDMASMQYIEIAYQFAGLARVMVASQNEMYEMQGQLPSWPYDRLIQLSDEKIAHDLPGNPVNAITIGELFVQAIGQAAESEKASREVPRCVVTAIDLNQLDLVTRSIDTLFLALMQGLGDPVIWSLRDRVFKTLHHWHCDPGSACRDTSAASIEDSAGRPMLSYDLFQMLSAMRDNFAPVRTEANALYEWFCVEMDEVRSRGDSLSERNIRNIIEKLAGADHLDYGAGDVLFTFFGGLRSPNDDSEPRLRFRHDDVNVSRQVNGLCKNLDSQSMQLLLRLKDRFDRLDREELQQAANTAKYLYEITTEVVKLLAPPEDDGPDQTADRLIVARYSSREIPASTPDGSAPPACGVAIYRPEHLDRIVGSQYLDFEFHRRVHWVSLLAAINLIRNHPNALWRVISSLLSTCSGPGRDDLLGRLVGQRSVLHRFGKQFRALQVPPTLTLTIVEKAEASLEARAEPPGETETDHGSQHAEQETTTGEEPLDRGFIYDLKLESNRQDAKVDTGKSYVSGRTVRKTLERLENIIRGQVDGDEESDALESFARDLGEDTLQQIDLASHVPNNGDAIPHLHLQLPKSLLGYPWEVMNEGTGMLCERFAIARQMMLEYGAARAPKARTAQKIRPLIIGDPRFDSDVVERTGIQQLQGAREEAREVQSLFTRLQDRLGGTIELHPATDVFIHRRITTHQVRKLLRSGQYDIVHFAGHAHHDEARPERSSWWLSDGQLWAQQIASTLDRCPSPPWLVYANACESSMSSGAPKRYRNNVFGLASAFINEGVTAYLGPLWPINDAVAYQIATDFYSDLLLERKTVGESIFMAKRNAKQRLEEDSFGAFNDLTWASMIVYGDATMKLLDSLGSEPERSERRETVTEIRSDHEYDRLLKRRRRYSTGGRSARPMQESIHKTRSLIRSSRMRPRKVIPPGHDIALQLVEINGLRFWQYRHGDESRNFVALPGSQIKHELETNERLRNRLGLRGEFFDEDYRRTVGTYHIRSDECGSIDDILSSYDTRLIDREGLYCVNADGTAHRVGKSETRRIRSRISRRHGRRILVLLHDVVGTTKSVVRSMGPTFTRRLHGEYATVLGFDHWTLKHSPSRNAQSLVRALTRLMGGCVEDLGAEAIDIIGIGRGGLVARALVESEYEEEHCEEDGRRGDEYERPGGHSDSQHGHIASAVRNVALIGTPNRGSRLSNAKHWGISADLLANNIHLDRTGLYGRLSGLLAHLSVLHAVEGRQLGSDREEAIVGMSFPVRRVGGEVPVQIRHVPDVPDGVRYYPVASSFAPSSVTNVPQILFDTQCDVGKMFDEPHDLLANVDQVLASRHIKSGAGLLVHPGGGAIGTLSHIPTDKHLQLVVAGGVHHACLISTPHVREFLLTHFVEDQ